MKYYICDACKFQFVRRNEVEKCPDCGSSLFYRKSRKNVICKNPSCDYKREEEMTVIE